MKNKYHQVITLLLLGGDHFQSVYRTKKAIPTVKEWNDFINLKAQEKQVNIDNFVVISAMTIYHPAE